MESLFSHTGITINFYHPLPLYSDDDSVIFSCNIYNSYSHDIASVGGYLSAEITMPVVSLDVEDWRRNGLGRRVKVFNKIGRCIWQGFVNEIEINMGASVSRVGPLNGIGNICGAYYTPVDFDVYPPIVGSETETPLVQDEVSQLQYGKWEKWISAGQAEEAAALQVRDVALADSSYPKSSDTLSIMSAESPSIRVSCVGDLYWLTAYVYNDDTAGVSYLTDKMKAVLIADPNGVINSNYNYIVDNLYLVGTSEDRNRLAWDIIKELLAIGNGSDDSRRLFGVYEDGLVTYSEFPTTVYYYHYLGDKSRKITKTDQSIVPPWEVVAGVWLQVPDFLSADTVSSSVVSSNPRNKFIESVRYVAPYTLDLSGGRNDRLSQMLAKIAYSGGML